MKKTISLLLAAATAAVMSVPAFADNPEIQVPDTEPTIQGDIMLIGENNAAFEIERWTVEAEPTSVKDGVVTYKTADGEGGGEVGIADAVILDSKGNVKELKDVESAKKLIFYMSGVKSASNVVPSIVVIDDGEGMVEVGKFSVDAEGALVNEANTLALNLDETVELARLSNLQDGIAEDGPAPTAEDLNGRWLMVFYTDSTRSIPAQTTPSKVIALNEDAVVTAPGPVVMEPQFTIDHVTVEENAEPQFDGAVIFDAEGSIKTAADIKPGDVLTLIQNKAKTAVEPEYVVIMKDVNDVGIAADLFVKSTTLGEYVDTQNGLALTIADDTPIVDLEGNAVSDRNLDNKYLLVFYDKITMSIPGITTPIKVVVLGGNDGIDTGDMFHKVVEIATDKDYNADTLLTRGMIITALAKEAAAAEDLTTDKYTDCDAGAYYAPYVAWATNSAIVNGFGDGTFRPNDAVTREQAAVIIKNYLTSVVKLTEVPMQKIAYADSEDISDWALESVMYCTSIDMLHGRGDGNFDPKANITCGEFDIMLGYMPK